MEFRRRHRSDVLFREARLFNAVWDIKNPEPPGGFDPVKRVQLATSVWDETAWPRSSYASSMKVRKRQIATIFLLNEDDIIDLCYIEKPIPNSHTAKEYLCIELERRAWEKYGGPPGLQAARARKADRAARRVARSNHPAVALAPPRNGRGKPRGGRAAAAHLQRQKTRAAQNNGLQIPAPPALVQPFAPPAESVVAGPSNLVRTPTRANLQRPENMLQRLPMPRQNVEPEIPAPPQDERAAAGPSTPVRAPNQQARMQQQAYDHIDLTLSDGENRKSSSGSARRTRLSAKKKVPVIQIDDVVDISD